MLQVKKLAGDTQLTREEVLDYMKWWRSLDERVRKDMTATREAAEAAEAERQQVLEQQREAAAQSAAVVKLKFQGEQRALHLSAKHCIPRR